MVATERGKDWTHLDPSLAIALARAAHETLEAERESIKERIDECKAKLETLQDAFDDASGRAEEARSQVGSVMSIFHKEGLHADFRDYPPKPTTARLELSAAVLSDEAFGSDGSDSSDDGTTEEVASEGMDN